MGKTIDIGGRIHNPEVGNVVTGANEILDDTKNKKQDVINSEVDSALEALDTNKQDKLTFDQTPTESSTNPVTSGGVYAADLALQQAIEAILTLIPSAASALNQLADKSFVNSSIATASATFRGTYNLVSDLHLSVTASHQDIATALASVVSTADNNDYCFVQIPTSDTSSDIRVTERYKFNGTAWGYEYDLNNSGFTATQWEAINSGITALLVTKLGALPTAAELATSLAGKQNVLTFDNVPVSGSDNPVKSGGLYQLFTAIDAKFPSDASANNKLVAENRLAAYVTAIIEALDASFDLTSADGHVTFRMTQANGVIASVQVLTSDIASASALTALGTRVSQNEVDIEALKAMYQALQGTPAVVIKPTDTWPVANPSQTVIYRVIDRTNTPPTYYEDYMWDGNGTTLADFILMAKYNNGIDAVPTAESSNLVESGGVAGVVNHIKMVGKGSTVTEYHPKHLVSGRYYRLKLLTRNLDYSTLNYGLFNIYYMLNSEQKFIYSYTKDAYTADIEILDTVDFQMPETYDDFIVAGRAIVGESYIFDIKDVTEEYTVKNLFGQAALSGSFTGKGNTFDYPTFNMYNIKGGCQYVLKPKSLTWNLTGIDWKRVVIGVAYTDSSDNKHDLFLAPRSVYNVVLFPMYAFTAPLEFKQIYVYGSAASGTVVEFDVIRIDNPTGYDELLNNGYFEGHGTVFSRQYLSGLIKGHTYRVYPKVRSWNKPFVQDGAFFAGIWFKNGVEQTALFRAPYVSGGENITNEYYDFECPDYDLIAIGGRADIGVNVLFSIIDITANLNVGSPLLYRGEHFLNKCMNTKYGEGIKIAWVDGVSAQGMAIYDNKIFLIRGTKYEVFEIGMLAPKQIASNLSRGVSGESDHGNGCQFAPTIESGETFPYLYVAEYFNKVCHVHRVTIDSGATLLQTITVASGLPLNTGGNTLIGDDGYIYSVSFNTIDDAADGIIKVVKFRQVSVSEGDVELGVNDVVDSFTITPPDVIPDSAIQGTKIYGGYLYLQFGASASTSKQGIYKINLMTKQIVSLLEFNSFATNEAEDFDFDFTAGILYSNVIGDFFIKTSF